MLEARDRSSSRTAQAAAMSACCTFTRIFRNIRYYTKENGNSFAELTYDAWGMPVSPNKLLNNDHGNYVYSTYTGHIFDTTLDIYFCEARFYDANTRQWMAMDPIKDGRGELVSVLFK